MAEPGNTGTPAPTTGSAPGSGGFGLGSWLPWVGLVVAGAVVGSVLGVAGVAGRPVLSETSANTGILIGLNVAARSCPGGPVVAELSPGSRVVALTRSADGASVQVRNPIDTRSRVWVPTGELTSDRGEAAVATLPVGTACPTVTVPALNAVAPVAPPAPAPGPKPKPAPGPAPAPDTTAPVVGSATINPSPDACKPTVTVPATDNVGVSSVTVTWTDSSTHSKAMTRAGGNNWTVQITIPTGWGAIVPLTFSAKDAAGNTGSNGSKFVGACPIG